MFSSHSASNYRAKSLLLIRYDQEVAQTVQGSGHVVKLTRTAAKSYSYVDMTPEAAAACKAALDAKYTRSYAAWAYSVDNYVVTIDETSVTERKSSVDNIVTSCGSRDVEITVNESDVKYVLSATQTVPNPASYFAAANARDYDEQVRPATTEGLSRYSPSNCAVSRDLDVRYSTVRLNAASGAAGYQYTRYANKSYAFIGMTQAAAESCARAKLSQYTRAYSYIDSSKTPAAAMGRVKIAIGASVSSNYNGHTWSVNVEVSETDIIASASNVSPATLFAAENARNYDGSSNLIFNSVSRSGDQATLYYTQRFQNFDVTQMLFEYRLENDLTWHSQNVQTGNRVTVPATGNFTCRLIYDACESNTLSVEES